MSTLCLSVSLFCRAHNLPQPLLSFGLLSIFPPGALYRTPAQSFGVKYTDQFEWASELKSPVWTGGPSHLTQVIYIFMEREREREM